MCQKIRDGQHRALAQQANSHEAKQRMLTMKKIDAYVELNGDMDAFSRVGDAYEISDAQWGLVDALCQDMHLVIKSLASEDFSSQLERRIEVLIDSDAARSKLWSFVARRA